MILTCREFRHCFRLTTPLHFLYTINVINIIICVWFEKADIINHELTVDMFIGTVQANFALSITNWKWCLNSGQIDILSVWSLGFISRAFSWGTDEETPDARQLYSQASEESSADDDIFASGCGFEWPVLLWGDWSSSLKSCSDWSVYHKFTVSLFRVRMSNSAAVPTPVEDVQGDGRWMSMVSFIIIIIINIIINLLLLLLL